ncbi:MAG: OsmC family protein [Candidatus Xenobiia bacterium LiM19]
MAVDISITYDGDLHCTALHEPSGSTFTTDAPVDNGGKGEYFSPTDLLGAALGGCVLTIMGLVAKRQNIDITGTKVHVIKEMTKEPPRRIESLKMTVTFPSALKINDADRTRLEQAARKCPVRESLNPEITVETRFIYS